MTEDAQARKLAELGERIERLIRDPDAVKAPLTRLAAPVMRALKWQPKLETRELRRLIERRELTDDEAAFLARRSFEAQLERARAELEDNVSEVERSQIVYGRIPMAYASWLHRMLVLMRQLERSVRRRERGRAAANRSRALEQWLRPPLAAKGNGEVVHVGAIDPLIAAAEDETESLARRRRLLEAARELLLEAAAALEIDAEALASRRRYIARAIARIDRYEAAGLKANVGLVHQLRQAADRGDVQRLCAALSALSELSEARGDHALSELVDRGLDRLWQGRDRFDPEAIAESLARSGGEVFDARIHKAMHDGYARAPESIAALRKQVESGKVRDAEVEMAEASLHPEAVPMMLRAALAVDGCFDVGGVLSPVRVVEEERRARLVQFPTQHLLLTHAASPADIPHAVIEDPRTVLLSLAAGRLLARKFVAQETVRRSRVVLRGEVRVYLLDGSASMLGSRARMRDAILIAELATLIARLADPHRTVAPLLYYRYFTRELGPAVRVDCEDAALEAIREVTSTVRVGGTDIEKALLSSFELIAGAQQQSDADLARAQIVLITDGEAPVSAEKLVSARERLGELPIGVSVIALGQENPALRSLAAAQRARGERVFYQYLSDAELEAIVSGREFGFAIHVPETGTKMSAELSEIVDEIEAHVRRHQARGEADARAQGAALEELELSLERDFGEAERARFEARAKDERALARRFERWFGRDTPQPASKAPELREPPPEDREDLTLLLTLLPSVAEVASLVGDDVLGRRADAIEVFERLLIDAGMPPWRYAELCRRYPGALEPARAAVRAAC